MLTPTLADPIESQADTLVERARAGDVGAFERIYRLHAARVFAVCARFADDRREAEELAQDAWVRAWERLDGFRGEAGFGTWMHRLTVNLVLDRRRADARWRKRLVPLELEDGAWSAPAGGAAPGSRLDLERAVRALPDGARLVFLLHEVEGYKHREIAERLDVAVGTVKAQLHRARRLLQGALER